MHRSHFLSAALLLVICKISAGQDTDSLSSLDPVVVSAGFSPAQSGKTGRNVLVIKGEKLSSLPVNSIDELLRFLPGIEIQARGPMGAQSDISIRGATFQQVLVILDGIRLNDPLTGHFSSYMPIAPSEIERIEILKGASSAIYGTEAVGGVIHIISKTYARTARASAANAQLTGGQFGLWGLQAGGRVVKGNTIVSAGLLSNNATGQMQRGTRGFFNLTTASLGLSTRLSPHWTLGLRSAYDYRDFSAQNFYTGFVSDTAKETISSWWQHARFSYAKGNVTWTTDVGYKQLEDTYAFNPRAVANNNRSGLTQILSRATWDLEPRVKLTGGAQYISRTIKSNDRGNHSVWQAALFGVLSWEPVPGLHIDPALRLDQHERGGFEWVPQVNLSYRTTRVQWRASAGRTIRDADFTERFNNYNRALVTSGRIGNPNLEAENGWNYEAGADWWASKSFRFSGTAFMRRQQKLIDWVNTPYAQMPRQSNLVPTGSYALATNIWKVNTTGMEADVQYRKQFNEKNLLDLQAGFLWVNNATGNNTPGIYLNAQARFLTNFNAQLQTGKFIFSVTGLYKQREEQKTTGGINATLSPQYFVANGKMEYTPRPQLGIFVQCDNAGNVRYSDLLGAPMPGRWWMAGIRAGLGKK